MGCHCLLRWSHHFMANRWGNCGNSVRLYFGGSHCISFGLQCFSSVYCIYYFFLFYYFFNLTYLFILYFWLHCVFVWRRRWYPTPVLLPGKSHGPRSLVGCSPWGRQESDTTERLHFPFSLSCIGEGNGNPLQYSCLENPRDGGAWWAAVYGVAQSWTRLKRLSSSSSSSRALLQPTFQYYEILKIFGLLQKDHM